MIRLSTQFDRVAARPVVAAPKSHGCCCCCCCCIVTVVGFSVVTARATSRAIRMHQATSPAAPPARAMDGWSVEPVGGEAVAPSPAVAASEIGATKATDTGDSTTDTTAASPAAISDGAKRTYAAPPSASTTAGTDTSGTPTPTTDAPSSSWVVLAALLVPATLCIVPGLLGGAYSMLQNVLSGLESYDRTIALVLTGTCWVFLAGVLAFLRLKGRLGILGMVIPSVLMVAATAAVAVEPGLFAAGPILTATMWIGGLVALHRRAGVKRSTAIALGVLLPIVFAIEFGLWLALLVSGVFT